MRLRIWQLSVLALCGFPLLTLGQTAGQNNSNSSALSGQAQVFMQLQQMQNQINQLQGTVEEQQLLIKQLQQESLERYQELDKRLSNTNSQPTKPASSDNSKAIDANQPLTPPTKQNTAAADPEQEKIYYNAAFGLIQKKDYAKAEQAFTAFLNKFPNSQYAGNAQYWLAEVNLVQGDSQGANTNFSKVIQQYPNHSKVPDAMYKLATVQQKLGNNDKAKELLNQLVAKYPNSSAATLAKRSLQTLN